MRVARIHKCVVCMLKVRRGPTILNNLSCPLSLVCVCRRQTKSHDKDLQRRDSRRIITTGTNNKSTNFITIIALSFNRGYNSRGNPSFHFWSSVLSPRWIDRWMDGPLIQLPVLFCGVKETETDSFSITFKFVIVGYGTTDHPQMNVNIR